MVNIRFLRDYLGFWKHQLNYNLYKKQEINHILPRGQVNILRVVSVPLSIILNFVETGKGLDYCARARSLMHSLFCVDSFPSEYKPNGQYRHVKEKNLMAEQPPPLVITFQLLSTAQHYFGDIRIQNGLSPKIESWSCLIFIFLSIWKINKQISQFSFCLRLLFLVWRFELDL